jgi:CubicO group peptidase (beta-lactamase class C family)
MNKPILHRIRFVFLLVILSLLIVPCHSQTMGSVEEEQESPQTIDDLNAAIDSLLIRYKIPGAGITIVTGNSIVCVGGLGYADLESKIPVDENTHFRTGSITKTFVSLGILKLVEEGKLDLQTPVKQILPDIDINNDWASSHPVRVVHLLEHTAGFNDPHFNDYYLDGDPDTPLLDGLKVSKHYLRVKWKPGEYRAYSSAGYMVAGIILEAVTGERFEDYLKREILEPLGMPTSTFKLNEETERLLARGYKAGYQPSRYWHTYSRPAGSLNSSAGEMAKFLQFMLKKGRVGERRILSESTFERMEMSTTDPAARAGLESRVGLGVGLNYDKGYKWIGHHGSIMGFCGAYTYCWELDIGCVVLTNRWDVDFVTGITRIWDTLKSYLVKDIEQPHRPPPVFVVSPDRLKDYTGCYAWCNPPQRLSAWIDLILNYRIVKEDDGTLICKNVFFGSWEPFIPVTENTFRGEDEFRASTVFITTPEKGRAYINGGSFYRKTSVWKPWLHGISVSLAFVFMVSGILYAVVWIPVYLFKCIAKRDSRPPYLRMRIIPLAAVIIIFLAFTLVGMQAADSVAYLGQRTFANVFFYFSTWVFAALSFLSLFFTVRSFKKPVRMMARIYGLVLSLSCVGMTLYWGYYGLIGLKWWAY